MTGTTDPVDPYWATWVFLGVLAGLTAFVLWLWRGNWKKWEALLPAPRPDGWDAVNRFIETRRGTDGIELGAAWRSLSDPRALWTLSWEEPDRLVAQRRPEYPPPPGMNSTYLNGGRDAEYRGLCVLLTGVSPTMVHQVLRTVTQLQPRADGADQVLEHLIDVGASPTGPALDLLTTDAVRAGRASRSGATMSLAAEPTRELDDRPAPLPPEDGGS